VYAIIIFMSSRRWQHGVDAFQQFALERGADRENADRG
jgi:hypothetical protein